MGDFHDERQEYIPANRIGRPLQRPLSAHVSNRPIPPPAPGPLQKTQTFGNGPSPYRRIHSAAPYRPPRPVSANYQPAPVAAWGDAQAGVSHATYAMGMGGGGGYGSMGGGLFSGMEPPPTYSRPDNTRAVPSKEPENMEEELRKMRLALGAFKEQNRVLRTERQRLEEELGRARVNLVKAEELMNAREKALSPTIGLTQMYRTPETTALVARLKEQVKTLRAEKDRFKGDLEELLRTTKATRVAELQSEAHALSQELSRQLEMTAIMRYRMEEAEAMAAAAQRKAEAAEALAREFTEAGSTLPQGPVRLAPGNTISSGRVRKTMLAMQQSHRVLLSQAALLRAVFPPGMSMESLAAKAALKAPTAGATEVLRYLRYHLNKLNTEMGGLPGGRGEDDLDVAATPPTAPKPPRPRPGRPRSAGCGPVGSGPTDGSKPVEPSSDPRVLSMGVADLVRELRLLDMDGFMARPDLEADVAEVADVAALLIAEHKRLTGSGSHSVFNGDDDEGDVSATENPLYRPVPQADEELVPAEAREADADDEKYEDDFAADGFEGEEHAAEDDGEGEAEDAEAEAAEPEPEPLDDVAAGDSPDEGESFKPPMLKESSSVRSLRSQRSAPDTPVKHQEGPASSVGDPVEYGTRRTSVAGSAYSTRGWQPEGEVLQEEEDEPGMAEIAVAAAMAVVFAEAVDGATEDGETKEGKEEEAEAGPPAAEDNDLANTGNLGPFGEDMHPPPDDDAVDAAYADLPPSASNVGDEEEAAAEEKQPTLDQAADEEQPQGDDEEALAALAAGVGLGLVAAAAVAGAEEEEQAPAGRAAGEEEEGEAPPPPAPDDGDDEAYKDVASAAADDDPPPADKDDPPPADDELAPAAAEASAADEKQASEEDEPEEDPPAAGAWWEQAAPADGNDEEEEEEEEDKAAGAGYGEDKPASTAGDQAAVVADVAEKAPEAPWWASDDQPAIEPAEEDAPVAAAAEVDPAPQADDDEPAPAAEESVKAPVAWTIGADDEEEVKPSPPAAQEEEEAPAAAAADDEPPAPAAEESYKAPVAWTIGADEPEEVKAPVADEEQATPDHDTEPAPAAEESVKAPVAWTIGADDDEPAAPPAAAAADDDATRDDGLPPMPASPPAAAADPDDWWEKSAPTADDGDEKPPAADDDGPVVAAGADDGDEKPPAADDDAAQTPYTGYGDDPVAAVQPPAPAEADDWWVQSAPTAGDDDSVLPADDGKPALAADDAEEKPPAEDDAVQTPKAGGDGDEPAAGGYGNEPAAGGYGDEPAAGVAADVAAAAPAEEADAWWSQAAAKADDDGGAAVPADGGEPAAPTYGEASQAADDQDAPGTPGGATKGQQEEYGNADDAADESPAKAGANGVDDDEAAGAGAAADEDTPAAAKADDDNDADAEPGVKPQAADDDFDGDVGPAGTSGLKADDDGLDGEPVVKADVADTEVAAAADEPQEAAAKPSPGPSPRYGGNSNSYGL